MKANPRRFIDKCVYTLHNIKCPALVTVDGKPDLAFSIVATNWGGPVLITLALHPDVYMRSLVNYEKSTSIMTFYHNDKFKLTTNIKLIRNLTDLEEIEQQKKRFEALKHLK